MKHHVYELLAPTFADDELISLDAVEAVAQLASDHAELNLLEKEEEKEEASRLPNEEAVTETPAAPLLASASEDISGYLSANTDYQVITKPPESSTSQQQGFRLHPLVWTGLGVLGIAALHSSDSDENGSSGNRAPSFPSATQELDMEEDQPLEIVAQATDRDGDGDELTYDIFTDPQNGSLTEGSEPGIYIYTPDNNFFGEDSFVIRVTDTEGARAVQTITVTVEAINDAPVLEEDVFAKVAQDTLYSVDVGASDVEGDALSYTFTQAANGVVTQGDSRGFYFYTPSSGFTGEDTFTVTVSDGELESTQTIYLRVGLDNADPVAQPTLTLNTEEDQEISFDIDATDPDGDSLSFSATDPSNGTVEQDGSNPGRLTYTPNANYFGPDSFIVTIEDGNGGSTTQEVTVDITAGTEDDVFTLSVEDVELAEGDDATSIMIFTLNLDGAPFDEDVTVNIEAIDGSATTGDDYNLLTSSVTFASGQDTATVEVEVIGDNSFGADESFELSFSGEKLAEDVTANGKILNDDPNPNEPVYTLSVDSAEVVEGNSGRKNLIFELQLDREAEQDFTIQVTTSDGTALAGEDYIALNTSVTFSKGENSAIVAVRVDGDTNFEEDEDFSVLFSNIQLTENITVLGTILNNDFNPNAEVPVISLDESSDTGIDSSDNITQQTAPNFTITAEAGGEVLIVRNGNIVGTATEESPGIYSYSSEPLQEGDYRFVALLSFTNVDDSLVGAPLDITVDLSSPEITAITADLTNDTVVLEFSEALGLFDDSQVQIFIDDVIANVTGVAKTELNSLSFTLAEDIQTGQLIDISIVAGAVSDTAGNTIDNILINDDPNGIII